MRYLLIIILLFAASQSWAQSLELTDFNTRRLQKQKTAMLVLGAWAVGNIGSGLALRGSQEGSTRYFHDMNAGWGAVNLVITGLGYWGTLRADPTSFDLAATINEQHKIQKILLFNAGLDVGYMLGGAYLIERSKNTDNRPERLEGFGKSIALQGAFLFVFDLATYWAHQKSNSELDAVLQGLQIGPNGVGLQLWF